MLRRLGRWLPVILVLILLATGLAAYRFQLGPRFLPWLSVDASTEPAKVAPPPGLELPDWSAPQPVATEITSTTAGGVDAAEVTTTLTQALGSEDVRSHLGRRVVVQVESLQGPELGSASAGYGPGHTAQPVTFTPASTTKVLTATAALQVLGPDATFTTRVMQAAPGELVLVGGGDPHLQRKPLTPEESQSTYPARADLRTLARQTVAALENEAATGAIRLSYDDSMFTGPTDNPAWRADYVRDDIVSPITALMVDGGREDAWRRSEDPSLAAAQAFAQALKKSGVRVKGQPRHQTAPAGAAELTEVRSAPLSDIVERVLEFSDNEGSETLAHHVGLAADSEGSFVGGAQATLEVLGDLGVDTSGIRLFDGSGLSRKNRITTRAMADVLRTAASPDHPDLRAVVTGMPVSGFSGSLGDRFAASDRRALGEVRAKTGTLTGVSSLAGYVTDLDGNSMIMVIAADKAPPGHTLDTEAALDEVAAALAGCRCAG